MLFQISSQQGGVIATLRRNHCHKFSSVLIPVFLEMSIQMRYLQSMTRDKIPNENARLKPIKTIMVYNDDTTDEAKAKPQIARVAVESIDSDLLDLDGGRLYKVPYAINDGVYACMNCECRFTIFFRWRYHCKACGDMVCSSCNGNYAYLENFERLKLQRVCVPCFKNKRIVHVVDNKPVKTV